MVDVTKYEGLKYWDSQWQIELYPDKWKKSTGSGRATHSKEESKSISPQLKMSFM